MFHARCDREEAERRELEQTKLSISMHRMLLSTVTANVFSWLSKEDVKLPRTPDEMILHFLRDEPLVPQATEEDLMLADPFFGISQPPAPSLDVFGAPPPWEGWSNG